MRHATPRLDDGKQPADDDAPFDIVEDMKDNLERYSDMMWLSAPIVSFRIRGSEQLCEFCMLLTDLLRRGRSRGAQISKRIEKCDFSAFPRCENSYFRSEPAKPMKTYRTDTGTYPNRPRRTRWKSKFRYLFVLCRALIENRGISGGATVRTYLRCRRPGRSAL